VPSLRWLPKHRPAGQENFGTLHLRSILCHVPTSTQPVPTSTRPSTFPRAPNQSRMETELKHCQASISQANKRTNHSEALLASILHEDPPYKMSFPHINHSEALLASILCEDPPYKMSFPLLNHNEALPASILHEDPPYKMSFPHIYVCV